MRGAPKGNKYHYKHGRKPERLYKIWKHMRQRCMNANTKNYTRYGGAGIKIYDEWSDFAVFREWALASGYNDKLTIDRIDYRGNYSPQNCRWASYVEQNNNRRDNRIIVCNGESHTMAEWSRITGVNVRTIFSRLKRGWAEDVAISKKVS